MRTTTGMAKIALSWLVVCAALVTVNPCLADSHAPTQTAKAKVYFQLSKDDFVRVLTDAGYPTSEVVVEGNGTVRARIVMGEVNVQAFLYASGKDLQLYAGFRGSGSMQVVNEWNRGQRFSRAYLDTDRDPVIESDIDIQGGVTAYALKMYLDRFKLSASKYRSNLARASA